MQLKKYISSWKKWLYFKKRSIFTWPLLVIFILVVSDLTKIKNIHCYCDGQICEVAVCGAARGYIGKNFLTLNKAKAISNLNVNGNYQKINIRSSSLNTVTLDFYSSVDYFIFNSMITAEKLKLSVDSPPPSSDSAAFFNRPSSEILDRIKNYQTLSIKVFPGGSHETVSTTSSQVYALTQEKKDSVWYKTAYELIKIVLAYTSVSGIYFLDNTVYFAQVGQPDIIISMDYEADKIIKSLQSVRFLTTIKKDPKIIDLRYANPIIR